jgi:hypothetical protein
VGNPEVAAAAGLLGYQPTTVDGRPVLVLAIAERKGSLPPAVIEGRQPCDQMNSPSGRSPSTAWAGGSAIWSP